MIWTLELTPAELREMEQALKERIAKFEANARGTEDARLAQLLRSRADTVRGCLQQLRDAEPA